MGAGVSGWPLANAVARVGQPGVVTGTALDGILARRLRLGDVGGHVRRTLSKLPVPGVAKRIIDGCFIDGGKAEDAVGKRCVCNGLTSNVGLGQIRKNGSREPALVTFGDDVKNVARFLPEGASSYTAAHVVDYLLS